jgi:hypothetical protein
MGCLNAYELDEENDKRLVGRLGDTLVASGFSLKTTCDHTAVVGGGLISGDSPITAACADAGGETCVLDGSRWQWQRLC